MLKKGSVIQSVYNDYTIIEQIGQGGNATVFLAKDNENASCAVKIIQRDTSNKTKLARLRHEIHFGKTCEHKNIISIQDEGFYSDMDNDYIFFVMPYYKYTLRELIKTDLPPSEILPIFEHLIIGIDYAHSLSIWHRDIKPENIFINENKDEVVLGDFGIAHFNKEQMIASVMTEKGERLANFQYAAPEQRVKNDTVDGRADIYALGLILNEMFTHRVISGTNYRKIASVNPQYAYLDEVVDEMINNDPAKRPYPASNVLIDIAAKSNSEQQKNKLAQLIQQEQAKSESKYQPLPVPKIKDIVFRNGYLELHLDYSPPSEWDKILRQGKYAHSTLFGYEPYRISMDEKGLLMAIKSYDARNDNTIRQIVVNIKKWLAPTTNLYNEMKTQEEIDKARREQQRIANEIRKIEDEERIKNTLRDLI